MVKRVRLLRVHAFLLDSIRADFPFFFRESKKAEIIENLPSRFRKARPCPRARVRSGPSRGGEARARPLLSQVMRSHALAPGDFPNIKRFRATLEECDFAEVNGALLPLSLGDEA